MIKYKTFAEFVRAKQWLKDEGYGNAQDDPADQDVSVARNVTTAAAKAMRSMQGNTVMNAVQGTDTNAQKKLLSKTITTASSKAPVDIGKVASVLDVKKPKVK
jgi:hypothetical protein